MTHRTGNIITILVKVSDVDERTHPLTRFVETLLIGKVSHALAHLRNPWGDGFLCRWAELMEFVEYPMAFRGELAVIHGAAFLLRKERPHVLAAMAGVGEGAFEGLLSSRLCCPTKLGWSSIVSAIDTADS